MWQRLHRGDYIWRELHENNGTVTRVQVQVHIHVRSRYEAQYSGITGGLCSPGLDKKCSRSR